MFDIVINFTTTESDQNIFTDFIVPKLRTFYSTTGDFENLFVDLDILFNSDYTQNITINTNLVTKAYANRTVSYKGNIQSIVLEGNNTIGQIRLNF